MAEVEILKKLRETVRLHGVKAGPIVTITDILEDHEKRLRRDHKVLQKMYKALEIHDKMLSCWITVCCERKHEKRLLDIEEYLKKLSKAVLPRE